MSTPGNQWQPPSANSPPSPPSHGGPPNYGAVPVRPAIPTATVPTALPVSVAPRPVPVPATPVPVGPRPAPAVVNRPQAVPVRPQAVPQPVNQPANQPGGAARPIPARPIPARPVPLPSKGEVPIVDEEAVEEQPKEIITPISASPWLISTIFHFVVVIVLALIIFVPKPDSQVELEVVYAEAIGEQLENDILDTGMEDPETTDAALAISEMKSVDDPLAAPPSIQELSLDSIGMSSDISAPTIGLALTGRETGNKKALLAAYGGTATTEESVKLGLEWLKKNQRADGSWSLEGPYSGGSTFENVTSATAMALLAFQGAGHTPVVGEHKKVVEKGWKALLALQDREGNFVREAGFNHRLYAQAQATIAICELYGMTKDSRYAAPADLALQYALKAQASEGGWRYQPGVDSDTSVTGWFVMALQSARMAKMEVPQEALDNVSRYLDSAGNPEGTRYGYQRGRAADVVMTAESMLCRQYLGWKRNDPRMISGAEYVSVHPLAYGEGQQNVYYWYYATQFLHHMESPYWHKWNSVMRQAVPTQQEKSGPEKGSWSPKDDEWGPHGGRLYVTCLSIYMLEVYYRHLPLYTGDALRQ